MACRAKYEAYIKLTFDAHNPKNTCIGSYH